jgi:hypothetical protein
MLIRFSILRILVSAAAFGAVFAAVRPCGVISVAGAFFGAFALFGLIILANRDNAGLIWRSAAWTFAGGYCGSLLSPSPLLHEPRRFLFCGLIIGWAVGALASFLGRSPGVRKRLDRPLPMLSGAMVAVALLLVAILWAFPGAAVSSVWKPVFASWVAILLSAGGILTGMASVSYASSAPRVLFGALTTIAAIASLFASLLSLGIRA